MYVSSASFHAHLSRAAASTRVWPLRASAFAVTGRKEEVAGRLVHLDILASLSSLADSPWSLPLRLFPLYPSKFLWYPVLLKHPYSFTTTPVHLHVMYVLSSRDRRRRSGGAL